MNAIETCSLTKYYCGKSRGIVDLDLNVSRGDIFGFIGSNGAGKSTTIRTLLGYISPTSGSASVLGCDISDTASIMKKVGYLPSEACFYHGMTAGEIISFSMKLRHADCTDEAKRLCDALELDTRRRADDLSLGNRKKVGIVCALMHKPELCILDEPTSGLDPLIQKQFWELLDDLNKRGSTVFLSSHILSEIQRHCKNAAIIRDGSIIAAGSVAELSHTNTRRVTLRGEFALPELAGIKNPTYAEGTHSFLYKGDIPPLLAAFSALPVEDISITEPDLDEIFLHYYEKESGK